MRPKNLRLPATALVLALALSGCSTATRSIPEEPLHELRTKPWTVMKEIRIEPDLEEKILALNPEHITDADVRNILAHAPAPRIINIHGGVYPAYLLMESLSTFFMGMGYPEARLRNPATGFFSYDCYRPAKELAGVIAWSYEKEGLRPMIIGHSQGGMQTIKVLQVLAGNYEKKIHPWNPVLRKRERKFTIIDPLTGQEVPVVGGDAKVSYASATGAGGLARTSPTQLSMLFVLRNIPDSVEDFSGYFMPFDILGADFAGLGGINLYHATGKAGIRNVRLPPGYEHISVLQTRHLVQGDPAIMDWISHKYEPSEEPKFDGTKFTTSSKNILWAADVWYSVKKHWALELQRFIRAKREHLAQSAVAAPAPTTTPPPPSPVPAA